MTATAKSSRRGKPEHAIQTAVFAHIRGLIPFLPELVLAHAPKNDFKRSGNAGRDFALWKYLESEGVQAGVPDVNIPIAAGGFIGFFMELKAPGNQPTEKQLNFLAAARLAGHFACWSDDLAEARKMVDVYLAPLLKARGIKL